MLNEGTVLGQRYEIISRIGSGGMADVYKAKDHKLNRMVAAKVMKAEFKEDATFITKFRKEAQAAAGLANPNIVNVYDVGEDNGLYYIVMELVEGITLKDYITRKGKLSVKEATSIAIQVSLGLEAAHNRGIIHRDVKPQNIIISTDGKVKLSDFGIAKATNSNTITSNAMGSVHYSSPEQVRGGFSNAQSDIYSLGITIYEMVTGRVPFDGETTVAIAIKHLQEEIEAPSRYTPDLPYSLEQIILKCTQKSPERRYENMSSLIDDLKHSLIDPQGDFVVLTPLSAHAQTVMMTPDEMETVRQAAEDTESKPRYNYDNDNDDNEETYDDDDEDDDEDYNYEIDDDDDDDDDDEGRSSGLEKVITIGGFIVGAVIICLLIYFIANAAGLLGGKAKTESTSSSASSSISTSTVTPTASAEGGTVTATPTQEADAKNQVTVPSITGKTAAEAQQILNALGLGAKQEGEEASDTVPAGQVSSQSVAEGTAVDKNTTVTFKISTGAATPTITNVTIPADVVGKSEQDATTQLTALGLVVSGNVTKQNDETVALGNVISVTPGVGSSVAPGTEVSLVVSLGSASAEGVSVSDYQGLTLEEVQSFLEGKGLVVAVTYDYNRNYNVGDIIGQSVEAGTSVPAGTTITLTINDPDQASGSISSDN
ncbi:MAG: Stk1 family PASTA domain-containing Ser/Thr kinase [Lachnospiraceae bacterium]|nr:Stk1 family PASTA domain-containing Ser/Thr kinase [Lachnospiraceae bacterium]